MLKHIFRAAFMLSFFLLSTTATAHDSKDVELALQQLDDVLTHRREIFNQKITALKAQKRELFELNEPALRLIKYEQLFTEYLHFNGDSAVFYAQKAVETAQQLNEHNAVIQAKIYLLTALTRKGVYILADKLSHQIGDVADVPKELQSQYASCLIEQSLRVKRLSTPLDSLLDSAKKTWADYSPYIDKDDWRYHFYRGTLFHEGDTARVKQMLSEAPHPSFVAANMVYVLALLYQEQGNDTEYEYYLVQSAINDVKLANTEVSRSCRSCKSLPLSAIWNVFTAIRRSAQRMLPPIATSRVLMMSCVCSIKSTRAFTHPCSIAWLSPRS